MEEGWIDMVLEKESAVPGAKPKFITIKVTESDQQRAKSTEVPTRFTCLNQSKRDQCHLGNQEPIQIQPIGVESQSEQG